MATKTLEQKRKQWLDKHLKVYLDDPSKRSLNERRQCCYRGVNNTSCMIGQDIPEKKYTETLEGYTVTHSIVFKLLPKSTQQLGEIFLRESQILHDLKGNWNEFGLSNIGQENYNELVAEYCTKTD